MKIKKEENYLQHYFVVRILFLLFLLLSLYNSNAIAEVVKSFEISGNSRISNEAIQAQTGIKKGDNVSKYVLNNAVKKMYATENFADISMEINKGVLFVNVAETPIVGDIYFTGSDKFDSDEVKKNMSIKPRQTYSKSKVKSDLDKFYATFQKMGFLNAYIEPKVVFLENNSVDVIFNIVEGSPSRVSSIGFVGNKRYSDRTLKSIMVSKELMALQVDHNSANFEDGRATLDANLIENFYRNRGYAKARVNKTTTSFNKKDYNFDILFEIDEGDKYKFGTSEVLTPVKKFQDDKKIKKAIETKEGRTFDAEKIGKTLSQMTEYLRSQGYANIRPSHKINYDEEEKIANIEYSLDVSQKVYIDRIIVSGNHKTKNNIILREMMIHEGDLYDKSKIDLSRDRLLMLGYFKNVQILENPIPNTDLIQLEIVVDEAFFGKLNFSLGYSGYYGIVGNISAVINNFLGRGFTVGASFDRSGYMESYSLSFSDPYFFGIHNIGFSASAHFSRFGDLGGGTYYTSLMLYKGYNFGGSFGLSFELANRLHFTTTISGSRYVYHMLGSFGYKLYEQLMGTRSSYNLALGLTYNKMNRPRYATKGYILQYSVTFGGLGIPEGQQFIKNVILSALNIPIIGEEDLIFHLEGEAGMVHSLKKGQIIGMENLFSLGGYTKMRGFNFYGIGPRIRKYYYTYNGNYYTDMYYASEGNRFYYFSAELRTPLFIPKDYGVFFSAFVDGGSVWGFAGANTEVIDVSNYPYSISREVVKDNAGLRLSAGVSVSWRNPLIGQIGFYYAKPLLKQPYDTTLEFGIQMGKEF